MVDEDKAKNDNSKNNTSTVIFFLLFAFIHTCPSLAKLNDQSPPPLNHILKSHKKKEAKKKQGLTDFTNDPNTFSSKSNSKPRLTTSVHRNLDDYTGCPSYTGFHL